ncbi:MAG: T9SS type A sorting domain-containing protein [Bacteroidales bacterium]|nr:T9SS type A sorting domain-containing protein [Bacteroidales bacterium]MCF8374891.1 T9SS type A sorting domain-containing protein [Bacteroidales bacterium]MCF8400130.1 T9SS type A sorting domain-containing protein [Bacteroidales bacterium]
MNRIHLIAFLFLFVCSLNAQDFHWAMNGLADADANNGKGQVVVADSEGNHIFVIQFAKWTEFNGIEYEALDDSPDEWPYGKDLLIVKAGPEGNILWVNHFGSLEDYQEDNALDVMIDRHDNILLCGELQSTEVYFNDELLEEAPFEQYIMKLNSDGALDWIRYPSAIPQGIAIDEENSYFFTGFFRKVGIYGIDTLYGADQGATSDMCIYKITEESELIWSNHAGVGAGQPSNNCKAKGMDVAVNANGDVFVVGQFDSRAGHSHVLILGDHSLTAPEDEVMGFIAKLNEDGEFVRADGGLAYALEIEIDKDDNLIMAGNYFYTLQNDFLHIEEDDYASREYVFKISPEYDSLWFVKSWSDITILKDMVMDEDSDLYVCSKFKEDLSLPDTMLSTSGDAITIYKIGQEGTLRWAAKVPGHANSPAGISCDPAHNVGYTGTFGQTVVFGEHVLSDENGGARYFLSLMDPPDSLPFGLDESIAGSSSIRVWPNPAFGNFTAQLPSDANIRLVNAAGASVPFQYTQKDGVATISLENAESGVYYLIVQQNDFIDCAKVLVW